jgi:hypothetical protein
VSILGTHLAQIFLLSELNNFVKDGSRRPSVIAEDVKDRVDARVHNNSFPICFVISTLRDCHSSTPIQKNLCQMGSKNAHRWTQTQTTFLEIPMCNTENILLLFKLPVKLQELCPLFYTSTNSTWLGLKYWHCIRINEGERQFIYFRKLCISKNFVVLKGCEFRKAKIRIADLIGCLEILFCRIEKGFVLIIDGSTILQHLLHFRKFIIIIFTPQWILIEDGGIAA